MTSGLWGVFSHLRLADEVGSGLWMVFAAGQTSELAVVAALLAFSAVYPDGRVRYPYQRGVVRVASVLVPVLPPLLLLSRPAITVSPYWPLLSPIEQSFYVPWLAWLAPAAMLLHHASFLLLPFAVLGFLAHRYWTAGANERVQIKWLLLALLLPASGTVFAQGLRALGIVQAAFTEVFFYVAMLPFHVLLPLTILIAMFRYRLFDVDMVIRRSIVYAGLSLLAGIVYVGGASALSVAAGARLPLTAAVLFTIAVTLAFRPFHQRLQRTASRLVFGDRPTHYQLLTRFGETLEHAYDLAELAPRIADAVRHGLDLTWTRVQLAFKAGEETILQPAGAVGIGLDEQPIAAMSVPLVHGDDRVGIIECGPRVEGDFTRRDRQLLAALARQAALAIRNARLAAELSARLDEIHRQAEELVASRARIIQAQQAERRRIERDIHDGVQQQLVSLMAKVRLTRNQLGRDAALADDTLAELQGETRQAMEDLRELARGIYPPALADLGLLQAVEGRTSTFPIPVSIETDPEMRQTRFHPDVEAAAYFFVSEALANALKHAKPSRVVLRMRTEGQSLTVEVEDDGVGMAPRDAFGSGLTGLRDRLEDVGGAFTIWSRPGKGTRLKTTLPARPPAAVSPG